MIAMARSKRRFKNVVEYAVLRGASILLRFLPYRGALAVAWFAAFIAHWVFGWRVKEARLRIREVFGDSKTEREVRKIAWLAMRNLLFGAVDSIRLPDLTLAWINKHIDHPPREALKFDLNKQGAILVTPHAGAWDLAAVGSQKLGMPIFTIVARQTNPLTDKFLNELRGVTGIQTIWRDKHVIRTTVRNLKEGKVLTILTDLRSRTPGVKARFLGKEANLVKGLGIFSRMGEAPVIPIFCTRVGWTRHHWKMFDPILPDLEADRDEDTLRITQAVMDLFTAEILAHPDQYFWYNKRWVLDPLEEGAADDPTKQSAEATT